MEYIRVGSYKKPLKEHPEKERLLWLRGPIIPFEKGVAASGASDDDVLSLLDHVAFFEIGKLPLPGTKSGLLDRLARENLIIPARAPKRWDITNLGAILFGKRLGEFESVARKAVRLIVREPRSNSHLEGTCLVAGLRSGFRRLDRLF